MMRQLTDDEVLALQSLLGLSKQAKLKLALGQTPEQMPIQIPVSNSAQVIGSISFPPQSFHILLNETISIESIKDFYREQLTATGWTEQEFSSLQNRGFKYAPDVVKRQLDRCCKFYYVPENLELSIEIKPDKSNESSQTTVVLSLERSPEDEAINLLNLPPFPPLTDPSGSLRLISSGGTSEEYSAFLCLEADLDLHHLYRHYKTQLQAENWTQIGGGQDESLIWGRWRTTDDRNRSWVGLLNIVKLGGVENQYSVQM